MQFQVKANLFTNSIRYLFDIKLIQQKCSHINSPVISRYQQTCVLFDFLVIFLVIVLAIVTEDEESTSIEKLKFYLENLNLMSDLYLSSELFYSIETA